MSRRSAPKVRSSCLPCTFVFLCVPVSFCGICVLPIHVVIFIAIRSPFRLSFSCLYNRDEKRTAQTLYCSAVLSKFYIHVYYISVRKSESFTLHPCFLLYLFTPYSDNLISSLCQCLQCLINLLLLDQNIIRIKSGYRKYTNLIFCKDRCDPGKNSYQ